MKYFKAIAAMSLNRVIGADGKIPWYLPEDFKWFKKMTLGNVVVMGRKTFEGLGLLGYDAGQKKFTSVRACGLCGTLSSGLVTCNSSGTRFECVKEECCPLSGQKVKARDEVVIESNDRIVMNLYKTINDHEVKVGEIVSVRKK